MLEPRNPEEEPWKEAEMSEYQPDFTVDDKAERSLNNSRDEKADEEYLASLIDLRAKDPGEEAVQFNVKAALKALCIHYAHRFFGPLAVPFLIKWFGRHFVMNLNIRPNLIYLLADLQPSMFLWMSAYRLLAGGEALPTFITFMLATCTMILIRDLLVSLKYGLYSSSQLEKMRTKTYPLSKNSEKFILVSWVKIPDSVVNRELSSAFRRLKVKAEVQFLYFKELSESIKVVLKQHDVPEPLLDDNVVPLNVFAKLLIQKASEVTKTREAYAANIAALVYGMLPIVLMITYFPSVPLGPIDYAFIVMSCMISAMFTRAFLLFILAGVYDFKRKKLMMSQCSSLLSSADAELFLLGHGQHTLNTHYPQTLMAWYNLRRVLLEFGRRFTMRVFLYSSLIFPVCAAAFAMVFLVVLQVVSVDLVVFFVPGMFLVACTITVIVYMVAAAVSLNYSFTVHRDILVTNMTELRRQHCAPESIEALQAFNEKLKQDEDLNPVKILGIKVDKSLYAKLAALAGSGVIGIVRAVSMI